MHSTPECPVILCVPVCIVHRSVRLYYVCATWQCCHACCYAHVHLIPVFIALWPDEVTQSGPRHIVRLQLPLPYLCCPVAWAAGVRGTAEGAGPVMSVASASWLRSNARSRALRYGVVGTMRNTPGASTRIRSVPRRSDHHHIASREQPSYVTSAPSEDTRLATH